MENTLLTIAEVADILRVSRQFVTDHSNGRSLPRIPRVKIGKSVRFRRSDIDAFIALCCSATNDEDSRQAKEEELGRLMGKAWQRESRRDA